MNWQIKFLSGWIEEEVVLTTASKCDTVNNMHSDWLDGQKQTLGKKDPGPTQ